MNQWVKDFQVKELIVNPSLRELREMAKKDETTTQFGSAMYISKARNRSAKNTYVVREGQEIGVDQQDIPLAKANEIVAQVHEYLKDKNMICLNRTLGLNPEKRFNCRLYISKDYATIPLMWNNILFPPIGDVEPDLVSVYVPEWPERVIFCYPVTGATFILGTDYFGESKKSFLRKAMYRMKQQGGLGFHAGSKVLNVKTDQGNIKEVGFIMFGLSGTGKTTLTIHDHGLTAPEGVIIRQDDVVLMNEQGCCYGTENGFYIKTEGLDESQKVLYNATIRPEVALENVKVLPDGKVDFDSDELTSNGRGVILREHVANTDDQIDLEKAHKIIFITRRNDIVPTVAKLSAEQAAAFFMLGESIETSAGDPAKAGQSKREVGTNPFIVGLEGEEGNRLLEILRQNPDMECYLLNTGSVGASKDFAGKKITIKISTEIMKQIAKDGITWRKDSYWGYLVPDKIVGLNLTEYEPQKYYSQFEYEELILKLMDERKNWLAKYPELNKEIVNSIPSKLPQTQEKKLAGK
jgi:phosphoenolpyruvate carboxykinase (ATP)